MIKRKPHFVDDRINDANLLARCLEDRDQPCPVCRYNLHGVKAGACPECGAELELRIGAVSRPLPYMTPWIVALLGIALPLGPIGVAAFRSTVRTGRFGPYRYLPGFVELWAVTAFLGAALVVLIVRRNWFCSKRRRWQWTRVCVTYLLIAVVLTIIFKHRVSLASWHLWSWIT